MMLDEGCSTWRVAASCYMGRHRTVLYGDDSVGIYAAQQASVPNAEL
jgi:hypothetical protein